MAELAQWSFLRIWGAVLGGVTLININIVTYIIVSMLIVTHRESWHMGE